MVDRFLPAMPFRGHFWVSSKVDIIHSYTVSRLVHGSFDFHYIVCARREECKTKLWTLDLIRNFCHESSQKDVPTAISYVYIYISNTYIQRGQFVQKHAKIRIWKVIPKNILGSP